MIPGALVPLDAWDGIRSRAFLLEKRSVSDSESLSCRARCCKEDGGVNFGKRAFLRGASLRVAEMFQKSTFSRIERAYSGLVNE